MEIKDDNSDNDDEDDIPLVIVTTRELHALMEEKEEEEKEEDKGEDDLVRVVAKEFSSLPHSPLNTITSMEIASTSEIVSTILTSISLSSPVAYQL